MAQTIVVQNAALEQARQRIADLEEQLGDRGDRLWRGSGPVRQRRALCGPAAGKRPGCGTAAVRRRFAWRPAAAEHWRRFSGRSGSRQAMGVAGGLLLGNALGGLFGGGSGRPRKPIRPLPRPRHSLLRQQPNRHSSPPLMVTARAFSAVSSTPSLETVEGTAAANKSSIADAGLVLAPSEKVSVGRPAGTFSIIASFILSEFAPILSHS